MQHTIVTLITVLSLLAILTNLPYYAMSENPSSNKTAIPPSVNATNPPLNIIRPSQGDLIKYFMHQGNYGKSARVIDLSSGISANATDIQAAGNGNITYVALQVKFSDGINRLFLSMSSDRGITFTKPIEITTPNSGNVSNVQIAATGQRMDAIWQETDLKNGINSVYIGSRMNLKDPVKVFKANANNTDAIDPKTESNGMHFWLQARIIKCPGGNVPCILGPREVYSHDGW